jgi:hypothetical protein
VRFPRVRFTVRRMMIAVAIVGGLIAGAQWCAKMARLSRAYAVKADFFESAAAPRTPPASLGMGQEEWDRARRKMGNLVLEYRRLSHAPWLAPDPTEPEL